MMSIKKEFTFEASHKLVNPNLSDKENKKVYGKCYDCISHGHSYKLIVTITGEVTDNGMIINFKDLKEMINKLIIDKVDHKFLNEIPFLKGAPTTCENMVIKFWNIIQDYSEKIKSNWVLKKIELWETKDSCAYCEVVDKEVIKCLKQ